MRAILQRVRRANVVIDGKIKSEIKTGLLVLFAVEKEGKIEDIDWLVKKILNMRIFSDNKGKMNQSVLDIGGEILVISQFTLFASTKKGNRPSFIQSEGPDRALEVYNIFIDSLEQQYPTKIKTGEFGADMQVSLTNDGPVTIGIDTEIRE